MLAGRMELIEYDDLDLAPMLSSPRISLDGMAKISAPVAEQPVETRYNLSSSSTDRMSFLTQMEVTHVPARVVQRKTTTQEVETLAEWMLNHPRDPTVTTIDSYFESFTRQVSFTWFYICVSWLRSADPLIFFQRSQIHFSA